MAIVAEVRGDAFDRHNELRKAWRCSYKELNFLVNWRIAHKKA
jgi:hypothetical protein